MNARTLLMAAMILIPGTLLRADNYSVTPLPKNFYIWPPYNRNVGNILNNHGQVAGMIFQNREEMIADDERDRKDKGRTGKRGRGKGPSFDRYGGAKAAYWDQNAGITIITLEAYTSKACAINDDGFIALYSYKEKKPLNHENPMTVLWNIKTNEVRVGPFGMAKNMSRMSVILLEAPDYTGNSRLWNVRDNTIIVAPKKEDLQPFLSPSNINGGRLHQPYNEMPDLVLSYGGKDHLLLPKDGTLIKRDGTSTVCLNDKDEVVALTIMDSVDKKYNTISKWSKGGIVTMSGILQEFTELKEYVFFGIVAFNNAGQVLLKAARQNTYSDPLFYYDLFLLTPNN